MLKTLLASLVAIIVGAVAASAATITVVIDDYYADVSNGFSIRDSDWDVVAYHGVGSLQSGYNSYTYDVEPNEWYRVAVQEVYRYVEHVGIYVNGDYVAGCDDCYFHGVRDVWVHAPEMSQVPLPASAALLLAGLGGLGIMRRRKTA